MCHKNVAQHKFAAIAFLYQRKTHLLGIVFMRKILKSILLLTAIVALPRLVNAGTVAVIKQIHSAQGIGAVTAPQTSNSISYTLGAAYTLGDKITFTFSDELSSIPYQIIVPAVDDVSPTYAIAGLEMGLLNSSSNQVTYRVTRVIQPTMPGGGSYTSQTTLGALVILGQIDYNVALLLNSALTLTVFSSTTFGEVFDSGGIPNATVAEAISQFGSATLPKTFSNIIDIEKNRQGFTTGPSDSLSWSATSPDTSGWLNLVSVINTKLTLLVKAPELDSNNFTSPSASLTLDQTAGSLTVSVPGEATTVSVQFDAPGDVVLEVQYFTLDAAYLYIKADGQYEVHQFSPLPAGAWTLNGAIAIIPYMPYSDSASQIMYVTNLGATEGDITVKAVDEYGATFDLGKVGVAGPNKVTKITRLIEDALTVKGFVSGKLTIYINVQIPANELIVYASYNTSGIRGFVQVAHIR